MKYIKIDTRDYVQTITLARPKWNALDIDYFQAIRTVFQNVKTNSDVRCIVLKSEYENVFTAGLDLKNPPSLPGSGIYIDDGKETGDAARDAIRFMKELDILQGAVNAIESCDKPVVVLIGGVCIGAGIDLITGCDIRLCTDTTLFSVREVDIGLAADVGTLQRLPRVVGNQSWVREVCFTGRDFGADEARCVGLVSKTYSLYQDMVRDGVQMAKEMASKPPLASMGTKHILNHARDHNVPESLQYVKVWNSVMLNSRDTIKATMNAIQRKKATFPKL
jgi:Delta3,5-Delta2,4-dienoyl-CoA isomerase